MNPEIYFLEPTFPGRIAIMPRPRGGEWLADEIQGYARSGLNWIVSLLTHGEVEELGLRDESKHCASYGLKFLTIAIQDRSVPPSKRDLERHARAVLAALQSGSSVAIHCRMGMGRSALVVASVLVLAGWTPEKAFQLIENARRTKVPDVEAQRIWVIEFSVGLRGRVSEV